MASDAGLGSSTESGNSLIKGAALDRDEQAEVSQVGVGSLTPLGPRVLEAPVWTRPSVSQASLKGRSLE